MSDRQIRDYDPRLEESDPIAVQAFQDEFSGIGARLTHLEGELHWYRLRYWDYTKKLRRNALYERCLERFHFDFIDRRSLNAIASSRDGVSLVACYRGSFESITAFFTLLLSHPEVLPDVGDPTHEKCWIRSLAGCDWSASLSAIMQGIDMLEAPPTDFPIDPERRLFAHRLAILAMDFLFFHEVGHLVNGHLEYLRGNAGVGGIDEFTFNLDSSLTPTDYQALELNADSHSVITMTQEWFMIPDLLPDTASFATANEAIQSLVLAMLSVFIMFDRTASAVVDYDVARHPHPAVRLANVYHGTSTVAQRHRPEAAEQVEAAWDLGFGRAFQMCSRLGVGSSVWHATEHDMEAVIESFTRTANRFAAIDRHLRPDLHRW